MPNEAAGHAGGLAVRAPPGKEPGGTRRGTNGVSTNGVTANFSCLTEGPFFGTPVKPTFTFPKVLGLTFFPSCKDPLPSQRPQQLVSTPFVRNQGPHAGSTSACVAARPWHPGDELARADAVPRGLAGALVLQANVTIDY